MPLASSLKGCCAFAATVVIISLTASLTAAPAAAADRDHHTKATAHRVHHAGTPHRSHHLARARPDSAYAPETPPAGPDAIAGPGYVFIPGKGIAGESCNMPTSTCTNEYRDVQ